jgi:zinc protease
MKLPRNALFARRHFDSLGEAPFAVLASDVQHRVLDNGLTVLLKEVYPASVVSLSLWAKVGSADEEDDEAGISHYVEHMLFKGTKKRPVGKIAQEIHAMGGYLNGFTSYHCTCYWIVLPSRYFNTALEIETDALINSLFDPEEAAKEVQVIIEELKMYEDRPESYCFEKLMETAYHSHRYRRPIIGFEDVLRAITPEYLVNYYKRYYVPNNMAVVVVGDIQADRTLDQIHAALGHLPRGEIRQSVSPPEPLQDGMRSLDLKGDIMNAHIQMGWHIPDLFSRESVACDVLATVLGDGRSSRLHQTLREKKSLVTSIGASVFLEKDPGLLVVDALLDPSKMEEAHKAVFIEIERTKQDGITERELQKAKNLVEASYVFAQETVEGQGKKLGYYEIMGDFTLAERYVQMLYQISAQDVLDAARKFLRDDNCSIVSYAPRKDGT